MSKVKLLAQLFSSNLLDAVGSDVIAVIIKNNQDPEQSDLICDSHAHCDANELMLEAYKDLYDSSSLGQKQFDIMNKAWSLAKSNSFYSVS